jgi:hypothetical protein
MTLAFEGIALMKYGIHAAEQQVRFHSPHYHSLLAILQARAGNKQDSLSAIRKAKELMFETGGLGYASTVAKHARQGPRTAKSSGGGGPANAV